jgi:hypothetical protein
MSDDGRFPDIYSRYLGKKDTGKGYEFQQAPQGSVPPPVVTFRDRLRWWTWDRWKRMKKIRAERDRQQQDIVQLKKSNREWPQQ